MTAKEKAQELVDKYKGYVNGYIGSSMLTNTEYTEQILSMAKNCVLIAIEEIETAIDWHVFEFPNAEYNYWEEVKQEIEKL